MEDPSDLQNTIRDIVEDDVSMIPAEPKYHWIQNSLEGKQDDIMSLGVILAEMASLTPSLSLVHRVTKIRDNIPYPPPGKYSKLLSTLINFICVRDRHKRPNIDDILNHPYVYSYYIVYGG